MQTASKTRSVIIMALVETPNMSFIAGVLHTMELP
jgi:hypothetical protein